MSKLYEKFGEFDSAMEINRAAAAQLAEGDKEAIMILAKENGIDEMDAQDYIDGMMPELCNLMTAATGKVQVEAESLGLALTMELWVEHIINMIGFDDGDQLKIGIRRKGKSLAELFGKLVVEASRTRKNTPREVVDAARKIDSSIPSTLPIGDVTKKRFEEIVKEYYTSPVAADIEEKSKGKKTKTKDPEETAKTEEATEEAGEEAREEVTAVSETENDTETLPEVAPVQQEEPVADEDNAGEGGDEE